MYKAMSTRQWHAFSPFIRPRGSLKASCGFSGPCFRACQRRRTLLAAVWRPFPPTKQCSSVNQPGCFVEWEYSLLNHCKRGSSGITQNRWTGAAGQTSRTSAFCWGLI